MRFVLAGVVAVLTAASFGRVTNGALNHPAPGIWGTITAGPTCPVEQAGHPCPPRPVAATVDVQKRGHNFASTQSNSAGDYAVGVPRAGTYTVVVVTGSTSPRCPTKTVTVGRTQSVQVNVTCDTGIR